MENVARESYNLYINGQWVDASDGGTFKSYCPANGEYLSTCAEATRAVSYTHLAFVSDFMVICARNAMHKVI